MNLKILLDTKMNIDKKASIRRTFSETSKSSSNNYRNRYSKVYVLFNAIAEVKGYHEVKISHMGKESCEFCDLSNARVKVKQFWKNFMGIKSLTELKDPELENLEGLLVKRLESLTKKKDG